MFLPTKVHQRHSHLASPFTPGGGLPSLITIILILFAHQAMSADRIAHQEIVQSKGSSELPILAKDAAHDAPILPIIADNNGEVLLHWTAPGDDNYQGRAAAYDIRYRQYIYGPIDNESRWQNATQVYGEPSPSLAGIRDSMLVSGLEPGERYYFGIKTRDEVGNSSGLSNSPSITASDLGLTLNIEINGWGTVFVEPEQNTYQNGETISLQATAYQEWWFTGWTGDVQSEANPLIFNITSDMNIAANFATEFIPGDANGDGSVISSDVTYLIGYFRGMLPAPDPFLAGDANGDCNVRGSDITYLIGYFRGIGPAPIRGDCDVTLISTKNAGRNSGE